MNRVKQWLAGKKTYLTAFAGIITAVVAWSTGDLSDKDFVVALFVAVQTIWLRAGIAKNSPKEKENAEE